MLLRQCTSIPMTAITLCAHLLGWYIAKRVVEYQYFEIASSNPNTMLLQNWNTKVKRGVLASRSPGIFPETFHLAKSGGEWLSFEH